MGCTNNALKCTYHKKQKNLFRIGGTTSAGGGGGGGGDIPPYQSLSIQCDHMI